MRIGILGGGQLAKFLVLASPSLNCEVQVFSPSSETCVEGLCPIEFSSFENQEALKRFFSDCDLITYEWENVPVRALRAACTRPDQVFPSLDVLEMVANRFSQKSFLRKRGLPTADFVLIEKPEELEKGVLSLGMPGILKTCQEGYDGKGQKVIRCSQDWKTAWDDLGRVPLVYEKWVNFDRELSLIACRSLNGEMKFYPLVENTHRDGILRKTIAPALGTTPKLEEAARSLAKAVGESMHYVGVMALELFQCGEALLINELASRVHNTGHWTLDGAMTSQFENHLRAGLGQTLGDTSLQRDTVMINIIGNIPEAKRFEKKQPGISLYLYGKSPKPNRKLGHINITSTPETPLAKNLLICEELLTF